MPARPREGASRGVPEIVEDRIARIAKGIHRRQSISRPVAWRTPCQKCQNKHSADKWRHTRKIPDEASFFADCGIGSRVGARPSGCGAPGRRLFAGRRHRARAGAGRYFRCRARAAGAGAGCPIVRVRIDDHPAKAELDDGVHRQPDVAPVFRSARRPPGRCAMCLDPPPWDSVIGTTFSR